MPDSTLPGCRREAQVAGRGLEKGPGAGGWWLLQPGRWDLSKPPSQPTCWGGEEERVSCPLPNPLTPGASGKLSP